MRPAHVLNYHTGSPRFHFDEASDAAAASAATAAAAAAKPWHDGVEADILGHWQNKGWKLDSAKDVAIAATKQTREAEKHFGVPVDRLLKLPDATAKPEDWLPVYQRLGAPKEAKEYDFSTVKNAAGTVIAEPLAEALRAAAFTKGLTKEAATTMAQAVVKHMDDVASADATVKSGKLAEEKATLAKNWGTKFDFNHLQAMEGAQKAGIGQDGVKAMESQIGYAATMEHFRKLGALRVEGAFHEGGGAGGGVNTREGAQARLTELEADKAWGKRLAAGDAVASAEWRQLTAMISGQAA